MISTWQWRNDEALGTLRRRLLWSIAGLGLFVSSTATAVAVGPDSAGATDLTELSLERLMEVTVTSASRKQQQLSDVASAIFVINREDIRRSGATTIPDLLRMVPGLQVGSIDSSKWTVASRGFSGLFVNKLLVMINGRSIYTPLFGGVFWDEKDTPLEDIERVEVIRGPGSTMWGANAVNGVINIITRSAHVTQGGYVAGGGGTHERGFGEARYGTTIGDNTSIRFYGKYFDRERSAVSSGPAYDGWHAVRGGFRADSTLSADYTMMVEGELYDARVGNVFTSPSLTAMQDVSPPSQFKNSGGHFLSRLEGALSETSKLALQLYYDRTDRIMSLVDDSRDTIDLDLNHTFTLLRNNEVTWGAGYRWTHERLTNKDFAIVVTPESRTDHLFSAFFQDEVTLLPDTLRFVVGSKFEHNEYSGWEVQPSVRLIWTPTKQQTLWGAVSRAVRTPTRAESDIRQNVSVNPSWPMVLAVIGNEDLSAENMLAYEVGIRTELQSSLSIDIATFYNRYTDIFQTVVGTPYAEPAGYVTIPQYTENGIRANSIGFELAADWQALDWWKLKGAYSYMRVHAEGSNQATVTRLEKSTPRQQASLRSLMNLGKKVELDLWARYVDDFETLSLTTLTEVDSYVTLDARIAWKPVKNLELSLVGTNLLDKRHPEFYSEMTTVRYEVRRGVYGKVVWSF